MPAHPRTSWPELAFDSWMLMGEASMVIWLRSLRLMTGGPAATREAQRMVAEKVTAGLTLMPVLMADMMKGGAALSAEALAAAALAQYGEPVRANRRRLARARRG